MRFGWLTRLFRGGDGLTCKQVAEVLQAYLDGETDAATVRRVTDHLDSCAGCLRESDVYRRIKASLASPPESVDADILARLERFVLEMPS